MSSREFPDDLSDEQVRQLVPSELADLPSKAQRAWLRGMAGRKGGARQERDRFKGPNATSIAPAEQHDEDNAVRVQRGTLTIDLFEEGE